MHLHTPRKQPPRPSRPSTPLQLTHSPNTQHTAPATNRATTTYLSSKAAPMYTPETRSSGFYRFTPSPFACLSAPCSTSISLISLAHAPPVSTNSSTFAHAAPQKPQTLHISTLCLSHLRLSWWPHIFTCKQVVLDRFRWRPPLPRRPHSPMWHHKSSIRIKATHFLRVCRPPRPPSVRPPLLHALDKLYLTLHDSGRLRREA